MASSATGARPMAPPTPPTCWARRRSPATPATPATLCGRWTPPPAPASTTLGKGIGSLNVKFAASAGECYGKEGLQVEVFAGCGWDLSFEEYLRMVSWMYLQGVKTIVNHGFFYSTRDERANDWPPSEFFQWAHWTGCRRPTG